MPRDQLHRASRPSLGPRAKHLWDGERAIGRWYDERVEWEAYFLYGPGAAWGNEPPALVSWGRTIVDSRNRLLRDFSALLAEADSGNEN